MHINVIYEDDGRIDIIDVPTDFVPQLDVAQSMFFKWLFDKKNNHEYWVTVNGEKSYCAYDVSAFIKWINTNYFNNINKISLVQKNAESPSESSIKLVF